MINITISIVVIQMPTKFNGSGHIKKQQPIRRQSQSKIERRRASLLKQFLKVIDQLNQDYLVKRHWLMLKNC